MQLHMPVLGKIHRMSGAAEFANTMSMLLSSGLNVDRAIEITAKTLNNAVLREDTQSMISALRRDTPWGNASATALNIQERFRKCVRWVRKPESWIPL